MGIEVLFNRMLSYVFLYGIYGRGFLSVGVVFVDVGFTFECVFYFLVDFLKVFLFMVFFRYFFFRLSGEFIVYLMVLDNFFGLLVIRVWMNFIFVLFFRKCMSSWVGKYGREG